MAQTEKKKAKRRAELFYFIGGPDRRLLSGSFSVYFHAQYFTGYGENLLLYDQRSDAFRIGISIYR